MSAQEISDVHVVSTRSLKVSALRLVTSQDLERVCRELAVRQVTPGFLKAGMASEGLRLRQSLRRELIASRFLDLAIRIAGFVLAVMVCFVVGLALLEYSGVDSGGRVVVQTGDTLWTVAMSVPEAPSIMAAVEDIKELNGLRSDTLSAGQDLILPRY